VPAAPTEAQQAAVDPALVDPGGMSMGNVDPGLAARLRADPSAYATQKIEGLVTFRMLSLAGINIDSLFDYLFLDVDSVERRMHTAARDLALELTRRALGVSRVTAENFRANLTQLSSAATSLRRVETFTFPSAIQALDQREAAIVGYMLPLEYKPKTTEVALFMLVRDLMSCCFGGAGPRPDEWVYVEMEGDSSSKFYPYLPIVVRGTLTVGRIEDEFGLSSGVYSMKAKSVEEFKAE
jgi:hypothetical protein